jgi:tryptophan synthase alpha chain
MSDRIAAMVQRLRERGERAFVPFVVLGDPDPDQSLQLVDALVEAGADMLELGFPFSDPPADGPVIQAADDRALAAGMTPPKAFELLAEIQRRHGIPVGLLIYYNLVLQYGVDAFYRRCAQVGVDGVLIADVPLEESAGCVAAARAHGVAPVFIGSTLSSDERLADIARVAGGYLYAVTRVGITGSEDELDAALAAELARFRRAVPLPILAGFGISTPAQVHQVLAAGADGAITGSALVRLIADHLDDPEAMLAAVTELATSLKAATRSEEG